MEEKRIKSRKRNIVSGEVKEIVKQDKGLGLKIISNNAKRLLSFLHLRKEKRDNDEEEKI